MRIISLVNMSRNHISYVFYLHGKLVIKGRLPAAISAHQVSLLPIEWLSEALGLAQRGWQRPLRAGNSIKLGHLEEVKVVTRFP